MTEPPLRDARLHVVHGGSVSSYVLSSHDALTIGRAAESDIVLDDPLVSRTHAVLNGGGPPSITDLGSVNGTIVNGERLSEGQSVSLRPGAVIEIGPVSLVVTHAEPSEASSPFPVGTAGMLSELGPEGTMEHVYRLVNIVAPSNLPVLLLGETGVGKEVIATEIHRRSKRANQSFVRLNCAAIPENLLEGEIFGYQRGAFTGATQAKAGLFEAADDGTVFLDEVGELPLSAQVKLLRVLEAQEVMRLGSLVPKKVNVRVVAATNRNLPEMSMLGTFRDDLFFRLNGVTIRIPPLRDRGSEVIALARTFAREAAQEGGHPPPVLTQEVIIALQEYDWPGNVRELRNVIRCAAVLSAGGAIEPRHILMQANRMGNSGGVPSVAAPRQIASITPPPSSRAPKFLGDESERRRIVEALDAFGGNQTRAARFLGIARRTLIKRIERLSIPRPRKASPELREGIGSYGDDDEDDFEDETRPDVSQQPRQRTGR